MAVRVVVEVGALAWQHPVVSCLVLLVFTPPFFPVVRFFSPLLISTALFMLALFTMRPRGGEEEPKDEDWEFRRVAEVKVWEDRSVRRRAADGSWTDWLRGVQEAGLLWIEAKLRNENWKGSALNDESVSILQEVSWARNDASAGEGEEGRVPATIVKADSKFALETSSAAVATTQNSEHASSVHHAPLGDLDISKQAAATPIENPSTDVDASSDLERSRRLVVAAVRRNFAGASSGLSVASESDVDAAVTASNSRKLQQLGDVIEEKKHAEKTGEHPPAHDLAVLQPTAAEQVDAAKDMIEDFTHTSGEVTAPNPHPKKAPDSPLFNHETGKKAAKKSSALSSDSSSSSGVEELSDSGSDSEFQIFPPVDPKKMKLHPPVKLDLEELERKLGTSLSHRAPRKCEITELTSPS